MILSTTLAASAALAAPVTAPEPSTPVAQAMLGYAAELGAKISNQADAAHGGSDVIACADCAQEPDCDPCVCCGKAECSQPEEGRDHA